MNPQELLEQIYARKWVAVAAIIIGLIVRLLKSDTKIPIDIPPRLRAPLAIALGAAAGALDKLGNMQGVTWTTALLEGVTAAVIAIVSHTLVINSARDGKELPIPGLIKEGEPPGPGKPPTIPPASPDLPVVVNTPTAQDKERGPLSKLVARGVMLACAMLLAGCALFTKEQTPKTVLALKDIACIAANAFLDSAAVDQICGLLSAEQKAAAREVQTATRQGVAKELASRARAQACEPDAGAEGGAR